MIRNLFVLFVLIIIALMFLAAFVSIVTPVNGSPDMNESVIVNNNDVFNRDWQSIDICMENGRPVILNAYDNGFIFVSKSGNVFSVVPDTWDGDPFLTLIATGASCSE